MGFQRTQAQDDGFDTCARLLVLALQVVAIGQQLGVLHVQGVVFPVQLAQALDEMIDLPAERLVVLFEHVPFALKSLSGYYRLPYPMLPRGLPMQAAEVPTLESLSLLLQRSQADCSASEFHGVLTGMLAGGARLNRGALMKSLEAHADTSAAFDEPAIAGLWQLQLKTLEDLGADDLMFQPLLPDDEESLADRVVALGDFCRGLLAGFGLTASASHPALAMESVREILQDLVSIAQVDSVDEADEEGEIAYAELHEFVRLGVIHLFEELAPREEHAHDAADPAPTVH